MAEVKQPMGVEYKKRVAMPSADQVKDLSVRDNSILLYRILPRKVTKGGIIVPADALSNNEAEYPHSGVVMVAGKSIKGLAYGDFIYYNQFAGRYVKDEESDVEYILIHENDLMLIKKGFDGYKDGFLK